MGYGKWTTQAYTNLRSTKGYDKARSVKDAFREENLHESMSPANIIIRESRDSEDHPNSIGIIVALDETGSMGEIPFQIVKETMPQLMETLFNSGVKDPHIMFCGVGDHKSDTAPLQVGQFESSTELLDQWLSRIYMEGHGGGNGGESYFLPWYLATKTSLDCLEKRGQKGFLFTIGDEACHESIDSYQMKQIFGDGEYSNYSDKDLLRMAQEKYNVYHIHIEHGQGQHYLESRWKNLLGENFITIRDKSLVAKTIAEIVSGNLSGGVSTEIAVNATAASVDDVVPEVL